jgi:predicted acyl esterase
VSLLSRAFGVQPHRAYAVRVQRDLVIPTFLRGHRIRLQVSGGAHPRYGRNLGIAEPFATSTRLQASDRTLLRDAQHPSAVWLPLHG